MLEDAAEKRARVRDKVAGLQQRIALHRRARTDPPAKLVSKHDRLLSKIRDLNARLRNG